MQDHPSTEQTGENKIEPSRRILVVEDHPDLASIMLRLLRAFRFDVEGVRSGEQAYPAALAFRPHAILLDIGMPGMNGFQIAELIHNDATLDDTVIIALSAYGPEMFPEQVRLANFDHHFTKPVDWDCLIPLLGN